MTTHFVVARTVPAVTRSRRGARVLRTAIATAVMLVFLALRVATSGPPTSLDPATNLGSQTAQQNLPMTVAGVALLVTLIANDPALAFVFILCDMNGFGALFDLDQWGVAHVFKFRDLEMGMVMAAATLFWLVRPPRAVMRSTQFGRYLTRVALAITGITLIYTLFTLRDQDLATTLRYSRQLYVWLLLLVSPQFIRTVRDLKVITTSLVAYIGMTSGLYVAQALAPPQTVLRYSQQMVTGTQTRVWSPAMGAIVIGGMAIFAYQLQAHRRRLVLWIIFALTAVATVMSQGRMLTGVFAASIAAMLLYRAFVTHRIGLAVRVAATAAVLLLACAAILWSANRLDPLVDLWNRRIGELETDVRAHQGSFTSRLAMFEYMPLVVHRNGGGLLAPWLGMGLLALTPDELAPMTFWGSISPPLWADNGLAGVTFTAGYFGILMLVLFVVTMLWRLRAHLGRFRQPLCQSVTIAAFLYFLFILPYMFFSAAFLGTWDDALAVVVLLTIAERSAATRLPRRVAA